MLVSSYKAHIKAINSVVFINLPKVLITGSYDCSCRLWTLGGRYLGTLGTPLPWKNLSPFKPAEEYVKSGRMPPDIKKVASFTTIKVITGEQTDAFKLLLEKSRAEDVEIDDNEANLHLYGKSLREPILGKHFGLPGRCAVEQRIDVDITASYIPVFTHLKIYEASNLEKPPTPPAIRRVARESYMEFYRPTKVDSHFAEETVEKDRRKSTPKMTIAFVSNETNNGNTGKDVD